MWNWLLQFTDRLDAAGIAYAIVGSVASSMYGEPRATNRGGSVDTAAIDEAANQLGLTAEWRLATQEST
jgi:hypothetical protein